jgi:Cu+-exporting ATPase
LALRCRAGIVLLWSRWRLDPAGEPTALVQAGIMEPEHAAGRTQGGGRSTGGRAMVKDPVCGMTIDEKTAAGTSEYQGQTIYFCAAVYKTRFDQDPAKYMKK